MSRKFQSFRRVSLFFFSLLTVLIGIQFALFVWQLETGRQITIPRPPGVEAFLPIGALVSFKYWVLKGIFNTIHPAGLVILLIVAVSGLLVKRGFCSWVCPVGLFSETAAAVRKRLFLKMPVMPPWPDFFLRGLKYFVLFFFLFAIFFLMDIHEIERFLFSPYNKITDVKMLKFFYPMSLFTGITLSLLVVLSFVFENFWCRYLCPYGALAGLLGLPSLFKIRRVEDTCTHCGKCTKVCPSRIDVHSAKTVLSPECTACMKCVDACPVKETLYLSASQKRARMNAPLFITLIAVLFIGGPGLARLLGRWNNSISIEEYRFHTRNIGLPYYECNRGTVADYSGYRNNLPADETGHH